MPQRPSLKASTILIDVDDTITHTRDERFADHVLDQLISEIHGVDMKEARRRIRVVCDPEHEDVEPHLPALGIEAERYDVALIQAARRCVRPHADAVAMIRQLHARQFSLYPATTNGRCICLAKLVVAGLADASGTSFFSALFGGAQVISSGKSGPPFFKALLERIGVPPGDVVMVGDNPQADLAFAQGAGIHQVVLPRRTQLQPWVVEPDGGIYVRSLEILSEWL